MLHNMGFNLHACMSGGISTSCAGLSRRMADCSCSSGTQANARFTDAGLELLWGFSHQAVASSKLVRIRASFLPVVRVERAMVWLAHASHGLAHTQSVMFDLQVPGIHGSMVPGLLAIHNFWHREFLHLTMTK